MANHVMDLELEDFTYDDDGLPIPIPSSAGTRHNNNNNRRKQNRENGTRGSSELVISDIDSGSSGLKPKAKPRTHGTRKFKDHSPVNDYLDSSNNALPEVETIRLDDDRSKHKPYVNIKRVETIETYRNDTYNNETDTNHKRKNNERRKERRKESGPTTIAQPEDLTQKGKEHFTEDAGGEKKSSRTWTPQPRPHKFTEVDKNEWEGDLQAMFDIDGVGYDATLTPTQLILSSMGSGKKRRNSRRGSGIFRSGSRGNLSMGSSVNLNMSGSQSIRLKDVYAANIHRRPTANQKSEGVCAGFIVSTFSTKDTNKLKVRHIAFDHPSEALSQQWVNRIKGILTGYKNRPRRVKVFLQPHAGKKLGEGLYRSHVVPMFTAAGVDHDVLELKYNEHVKQEFIHLNLESYDCIVCVGGDGTVGEVVAGLLTRSQDLHNVSVKTGFSPVTAALPVGIIPSGTTNQIAYSVTGTDDPISGILHVILGHFVPVDVCSVFSEEKFLTWTFNSHYGYGANVVKFADRYKVLGGNRLDAAFLKAFTKAKLRAYECDIEYIPSVNSEASHTNDGEMCYRGCRVCKCDDDSGSVTSDVVEEYDPLSNSSTSSTIMDLTEKDPWKHCKGEYFNVGVLSIPGRARFAPQGLSKFTHLHDGCMDLILVKSTERKEFLRYLKRHGGSKNQLAFPFVEVHRVTEVRFRPRLPITWNYKDYNYSEIDYEMSKVKKRVQTRSKSMQMIDIPNSLDDDTDTDDDDTDGDDNIQPLKPRSNSMNVLDDDSDSGTDSTPSSENSKSKGSLRKQSSTSQPTQSTQNARPYRMSFTDQEIIRRRNMQAKKDGKKKAKEESKMKSMWSFDNNLHKKYLNIDIKVHKGLLRLCGEGISPDTELEENKHSCLPAMIL